MLGAPRLSHRDQSFNMHSLLRFLREPVVHFLAIGFLIFTVYLALNENAPSDSVSKRAEATVAETKQLIEQFRKTWLRSPTVEELNGLIEARIKEHILVQEALALSMDQGDAVVRQRLRQKMDFLITSAAGAEVPSDADLLAFYEAGPDKFTPEPRLGFRQVFLGEAAEQDALVEDLRALNSGMNPGEFGRPSLLPAQVPLSTRSAVDGTFGQGFFASLRGLDQGLWQGPVRSGYGLHLVLVVEAETRPVPEFNTIRDLVLEDYRAVRSQEQADAIFRKISAEYEIVTPDPATRAELLK